MQFIANGPDIPNALLQAHGDGRVVFFCGSGISYPAGLPDFKGLVKAIYKRVGDTPKEPEKGAIKRKQFDLVLDLLGRRLPGQRLEVYRALAESLQPRSNRKGALDTHVALLRLARSQDGATRLVTTNFDRLFLHAATQMNTSLKVYEAPLLPIPKNIRWNGLVHMHGLLPKDNDEAALMQLVVTSGDFGLAYLVERWAARFVSELFRGYIVCFVGYSVNDPVLRYMTDAFAADRMSGENMPPAYAFWGYQSGDEHKKGFPWETESLTPILYDPKNGHAALHGTLKNWAELWRDGTLGKERIVLQFANVRPEESTKQDDWVGRLLWALSDESGIPAKRFADLSPVPPLEWLELVSDCRYRFVNRNHPATTLLSSVDTDLHSGHTLVPVLSTLVPQGTFATSAGHGGQLDSAMRHLTRWLIRHLDNPKLIIWFVSQGGQLHHHLRWLIEGRLDEIARLEQEQKVAELEKIREGAPDAIPSPIMRTLWRLLLTGRIKCRGQDCNIYQRKEHFDRDGITATLRMQLRELIAPVIELREGARWNVAIDEEASGDPPPRVHWELVLASDQPLAGLPNRSASAWLGSLPELLDDFELLLRDALDLMKELGDASDHKDPSYWHLPSISPHHQNRGFHDWTSLIELLRDAWLATLGRDSKRATRKAQDWFECPYPTFKRLALFAASHKYCITGDEWVGWLLADDAWWLWSIAVQRETMRLLVLQGSELPPQAQARLEEAILSGPPRRMFKADLEFEHWQELVDHLVWLHLAKLSLSGLGLGARAGERLKALSAAHPEWEIAANERDEFSFWMSGTGDPDFQARTKPDLAPRELQDLVQWLKRPHSDYRAYYEDDWRETCRMRFRHSWLALCALAREGLWPASRWSTALSAWSEDDRAK